MQHLSHASSDHKHEACPLSTDLTVATSYSMHGSDTSKTYNTFFQVVCKISQITHLTCEFLTEKKLIFDAWLYLSNQFPSSKYHQITQSQHPADHKDQITNIIGVEQLRSRDRDRDRDRYLSGMDLEIDAGDPLEVLLEEPLRVVLSDLLPRH